MELPAIFIPSKGRFDKRRTTWNLLLQESIPFTLVVEPAEEKLYRYVFRENKLSKKVSIEVLPLDNQGIGYARNHIVFTLAPAHTWFWMIDDDIISFRAIKKTTGDSIVVPASTALRIANPRDAVKIDPKTCIIGMEYAQFMFRKDQKFYMINSYANICICVNRSLFPNNGLDIQYRFPIREDYDLCMQVIAQGGVVFRYKCVGFCAPAIGSRLGGMTAFYANKKDLIRKCNVMMTELWGSSICTETRKGKHPNERFDLKVYWKRLDKVAKNALTDETNYMKMMNQPHACELRRLLV